MLRLTPRRKPSRRKRRDNRILQARLRPRFFYGREAMGIPRQRAAGRPGAGISALGAMSAQPTYGFSGRDNSFFARFEVLYLRQQLSCLSAFEFDGVRGFEFLGALELLV